MFHGEDEFGQLFHLVDEKQFNINAPLGHLLFRTNDEWRMRINPKDPYSALGSFSNIPAEGFVGISPTKEFWGNGPGPFSRLHLAEPGSINAQAIGYRPWQRNGISFTGNGDQGYIGQKYDNEEQETDKTDMVVQWSDNPGNWKGDRMRFIFTSRYDPGSPTGMNSLEGLEGMRLYPDEHDFINVGIGDFFAGGDDPTERLDVRTGRVRIRQLPTDAIAPTLTKFLVVDDTPGPDFGVVKWRNVPPGTGGGCEWTLLGAPGSSSNIATAYNGNPGCPQGNRFVGIGTNNLTYKFHVQHKESDVAASGGIYSNFLADDVGSWTVGIFSNVEPEVPSGSLNNGDALRGFIRNVGTNDPASASSGTGMRATAFMTNPLYAQNQYGAYGSSESTNGSIKNSYGLYGSSSASGNANVGKSYGVFGSATSTDPAAVCYGVYGQSGGPDIYTPPGGATSHTKWAGYFPGYTYTPAGLWSSSDEQLKQNIEDLPPGLALEKLQQLSPKTYDYNHQQFAFMNLPIEHQYGLIAQEVENVLPELVTNIHQPATLDTSGIEVSPAIDFKAMNYQGLIPLLIAGFQAQQVQIDQQQATIAQLQDQINNCCAAQGGLAPQGGLERRMASEENDLQEQRLLIIPNPVADLTTLEYYVPRAGQVSLSVSTSDGKPLGTLREEQAEPGAYSYPWNTTKLASGTYFCTYLLDGAVVVKRAVKVK
jgi:hypothetical protein